MVRLYGFSASNYYNKVKLALLEKVVAFEEVEVFPSGAEPFLTDSPMGKVPFVKIEQGALSESQAIVEYLEDSFPESPLYPADVLARAKCRELIHLMELYLEWPARRLYPAAFFGGSASAALKKEVHAQLTKGVSAFTRLVRFTPYIAGDTFTLADCAAIVHLPLVASASKIIYGENVLAAVPGLKDYLGEMGSRPQVERVNTDRKAGLESFIAYRAKFQTTLGMAARTG